MMVGKHLKNIKMVITNCKKIDGYIELLCNQEDIETFAVFLHYQDCCKKFQISCSLEICEHCKYHVFRIEKKNNNLIDDFYQEFKKLNF